MKRILRRINVWIKKYKLLNIILKIILWDFIMLLYLFASAFLFVILENQNVFDYINPYFLIPIISLLTSVIYTGAYGIVDIPEKKKFHFSWKAMVGSFLAILLFSSICWLFFFCK